MVKHIRQNKYKMNEWIIVHSFIWCFSLLRAAEDLAIKKMLKEDFGGGMQDFQYKDKAFFKDIEDEHAFFTSEERQYILRNMLNDLRAEKGEELGKVKFLEGQSIGK